MAFRMILGFLIGISGTLNTYHGATIFLQLRKSGRKLVALLSILLIVLVLGINVASIVSNINNCLKEGDRPGLAALVVFLILGCCAGVITSLLLERNKRRRQATMETVHETLQEMVEHYTSNPVLVLPSTDGGKYVKRVIDEVVTNLHSVYHGDILRQQCDQFDETAVVDERNLDINGGEINIPLDILQNVTYTNALSGRTAVLRKGSRLRILVLRLANGEYSLYSAYSCTFIGVYKEREWECLGTYGGPRASSSRLKPLLLDSLGILLQHATNLDGTEGGSLSLQEAVEHYEKFGVTINKKRRIPLVRP